MSESKGKRFYFVLLADILWWFHVAVVIAVVFGFFAQFFAPRFAFWELMLIGIVMVSQFIWFGNCPSTELENYLRKKVDPNYRISPDGCIADAVFALFKVRIEGKWVSLAGICILALTLLVYLLQSYQVLF